MFPVYNVVKRKIEWLNLDDFKLGGNILTFSYSCDKKYNITTNENVCFIDSYDDKEDISSIALYQEVESKIRYSITREYIKTFEYSDFFSEDK